VVASDGSTDRTVEAAWRAGAHRVLDLPRVGKITALNAGVEASSGEVLVFTDADSLFFPDTLDELIANFADPIVGGVSANEVSRIEVDAPGVARGEGSYWRYEQWIKRYEDKVGSAVSASGRLYAVRRSLFCPSTVTAGTDDFVISTQVVKSVGDLRSTSARTCSSTHLDATPSCDGRFVMNRACALPSRSELSCPGAGFYSVQVLSHKVLRQFVPFFLAGRAASAWLTTSSAAWWLVLGPARLLRPRRSGWRSGARMGKGARCGSRTTSAWSMLPPPSPCSRARRRPLREMGCREARPVAPQARDPRLIRCAGAPASFGRAPTTPPSRSCGESSRLERKRHRLPRW
jgi:hypothetical protein